MHLGEARNLFLATVICCLVDPKALAGALPQRDRSSQRIPENRIGSGRMSQYGSIHGIF
jgi:hypothetical protein